MNIGIMTAWNQNAGPAICAQLLARQWVKEEHNVKIFSYILSDFHGTAIVGEDEDFVYRCFSARGKGFLDPRPILENRFDIFMANDVGMFPMDELCKIFSLIKRSAKTINIIHESGPSPNPSFYNFDWDRIVCFDQRYKDFLSKIYSPDLITIIPHPLYPWRPGDKIEARKKLNLPLDKYILFVFGQGLDEKLRILGNLRVLSKKYNIVLLIVSLEEPGPLKENGLTIEYRKQAPDLYTLYDYLYSADALIINKGLGEGKVVISTTIYQCLGSGRPILTYDSELVETVPDCVVIKYKTYEEFEKKLIKCFEDKAWIKKIIQAQEDYVKRHSPDKIAKEYLSLFREGRENEDRND